MEWEAFEEEFGPLTLHKRIDWAVAMLIRHQELMAAGSNQGAVPPASDFLPQWESEGEGAHITDWLSAVARKP